MAIPLIFIQSASLLMILSATTTHAQCNSSMIGYSLVGHSYKNFSAPTPLDCYNTCKAEEPDCRSFNFHALEGGVCELNKHSIESYAGDLKPSDASIYFHSCLRDRYGSKPSLAANSCAEILHHTDSLGDGWYWLMATQSSGNKTAEEIYCNMTNAGNMDSSFDLVFPPQRNMSNYVMVDAITQSLSQLTVSLWLKSTERNLVPISYAVSSEVNSILIYIDETNLLRFVVGGQHINGYPGDLDDDKWHHVCGTWESTTGTAQIFIDGTLKITKTGVLTSGTIQSGGKLVLGLDQDLVGGGFDIDQSFVGELAHVYLWNTALTADVIANMQRVCKEFPHPGHIVGWSSFGANLNGEVTRRNFSRCHYEPPL